MWTAIFQCGVPGVDNYIIMILHYGLVTSSAVKANYQQAYRQHAAHIEKRFKYEGGGGGGRLEKVS
jgi:hypothetical protein